MVSNHRDKETSTETNAMNICESMLNLPDMTIVCFDTSDPDVARLHVQSKPKRTLLYAGVSHFMACLLVG